MIPENSMQKQQTKYLKEKHVFPDKWNSNQSKHHTNLTVPLCSNNIGKTTDTIISSWGIFQFC